MTPANLAKPEARSGMVNLRIRPELRQLIDQAASLQGKTRSDFMLEAARRAAEETLLDQALIRVGPEAYARFEALLDAPPRPTAELRKLLLTPAPWD